MEEAQLRIRPEEKEKSATIHPRASIDCIPLLEAAGLKLYRENTFRILGLPVDAAAKDIARHTDKLKKFEELGFGPANTAAFALEPPPTLDQIREAIQRLREPERRLVDEFFWFWPATFGKSAQDPAIQAALQGDAAKAASIWEREENDDVDRFVAVHNLAVMHHLLAVDATLQHIATGADEQTQKQINQHWKEAHRRWEKIALEDFVWDAIKDRIHAFDDPRLTTGFARRMRDSFPEALDKVNAEAALRFAEQGRFDWARIHVDFMRETHQGLDNVTKTMELVLAPIRAQIREGIKNARQTSQNNPKQGGEVALRLIDECKRIHYLYDILHGSDAPHKTELFDEVAWASLDSVIIYQKETSDDSLFVEVLRAALGLASAPELRERIQRNIGIGETNLRWEELKPLRENLDRILESKNETKVQFVEIKQQMIPELARLAETQSAEPDLVNEFSNMLGQALRSISIDAHNDEDDFETAVATSQLAACLARTPELKKRISDDLIILRESLDSARKGGLYLDLRGDKISMNRKSVGYNTQEIPVRGINGIRFGQEAQYANGQYTGRSYRVDIMGNGTEFLIETKRAFRSDEQASGDYAKLVDGLYENVVTRLIKNLSKSILEGKVHQMGPVKVVTEGVYIAGPGLEGKDHFIPWSDLRFGSRDGKLNVRSESDPSLQVHLRLRDDWNAVIFETLINAVIEGKKKKAAQAVNQ